MSETPSTLQIVSWRSMELLFVRYRWRRWVEFYSEASFSSAFLHLFSFLTLFSHPTYSVCTLLVLVLTVGINMKTSFAFQLERKM